MKPTTNTMRRMLFRSGLFAVLFLTAAMAADAAQSLRQVRSKWIGQNVGNLIDQHGYPDNVFEAQNGNKVYAYVKTKRRMYSVPIYIPPATHEVDIYQPNSGTYSYGTSTTQGTWAFEYRSRVTRCTGYFEVDPGHVVIGVRFKGEECPR